MTDSWRKAVVQEAESWLGTPYHPHARIKGAGVDCLTFLAEVYAAAGIIEPIVDIPFYRTDGMFHQKEETYLNGVLKYGTEIIGPPEPGDAVLFKWGPLFWHGAIVIKWPKLIHASPSHHGVRYDWGHTGRLGWRVRKYFSPGTES